MENSAAALNGSAATPTAVRTGMEAPAGKHPAYTCNGQPSASLGRYTNLVEARQVLGVIVHEDGNADD